LTGLAVDTVYHFRVRAKDSAGNLAVSGDYSFQTGDSDNNTKLVLYYPAISSVPLQTAAARSTDEYTGIALSNLDGGDATLLFTAYNEAGSALSGADVVNPVTKVLKPGEQMPIVDWQLFGSGIEAAGPLGWIQVDSSTTKLAGFFMAFDSGLSLLDGAEISSSLLSSFVLPEITSQDFTKILIANPNPEPALVRLDLMRADGGIRDSEERTIAGHGTLTADLFAEIFKDVAADPSDYIRAVSSKGLLPYETLGKTSRDFALLTGQDRTSDASRLYSPQYVLGGPWHSTLSIVNLDSAAGQVALKFIGDNGAQIGSTQFRDIGGNGKIHISSSDFFGATDPRQIIQGYVEVIGLGVRLAGSVVFGDAQKGIFSSALPLVSSLQKSVIFSHLASDGQYFTGLAILNPADSDTLATIDLYGSDGTLEMSTTQTIPARQRKSRLLTEYFPALIGQNRISGYFKVTVFGEVACFALFGTRDLSVLSAIPAQPVP
jgi:hypothetical protein